MKHKSRFIALASAVLTLALAQVEFGTIESLPSGVQSAHAAGLPFKALTVKKNSSTQIKGRINSGKKIDLKWAANSSVACFPATRFDHFSGKHVIYRAELPARSVLSIELTPKSKDADLSLYAYSVGKGDKKTLPPNIPGVVSCEASYGSSNRAQPYNPGKTESVQLNATTNAYTVYIGVAGARGLSKGDFTLLAKLETAKPAPTGKVKSARTIKVKPNSKAKAKGRLNGGPQIDLKWAANSSVACFPATRFDHFDGAHQLYRAELPPHSELTIEAVPKKSNLDISLYAYSVGKGDTKTLPPRVHSTVSCEASYGSNNRRKPYNPGKSEKVKLNATTGSYTVYIGVAGAQGVKSGDFELKLALKTAPPKKTGKVKRATDVAVGPNTTKTVKGKLAGGADIDLSWAANSSVACFPATRFDHFSGLHQVFRTELPPYSELFIEAVPKRRDLDISLYAYSVGKGDRKRLPPNVPGAVSCEASYGTRSMSKPFNPGKSEKVRLNAIRNPYTVYVGVAGAKGIKKGDFELKFKLKTAPPKKTGKVTSAKVVEVDGNTTKTVKGKLDAGADIDLSWAANSSVACFPATRNEHFNGLHKVFRTELPPYSELKIEAIPKRKDLDLSLYAYSVGKGDTKSLPPKVHRAVSCEASSGSKNYKKPFNPGATESVKPNAIRNPYTVYVGVTGAKGIKKGDFELKFHLKTRAAEPTGKVKSVKLIKTAVGKTVAVKGKLDGAPEIALSWAANSSVACFPATRNEHFNGGHVVYKLSLPSYSEMKIRATPNDPKLDISLFAYSMGTTGKDRLPPDLPSVVSCEASYGTRSRTSPYNPGKTEEVKLMAIRNPYTVFVGVAGAQKVKKGDFKLEVELKKR